MEDSGFSFCSSNQAWDYASILDPCALPEDGANSLIGLEALLRDTELYLDEESRSWSLGSSPVSTDGITASALDRTPSVQTGCRPAAPGSTIAVNLPPSTAVLGRGRIRKTATRRQAKPKSARSKLPSQPHPRSSLTFKHLAPGNGSPMSRASSAHSVAVISGGSRLAGTGPDSRASQPSLDSGTGFALHPVCAPAESQLMPAVSLMASASGASASAPSLHLTPPSPGGPPGPGCPQLHLRLCQPTLHLTSVLPVRVSATPPTINFNGHAPGSCDEAEAMGATTA